MSSTKFVFFGPIGKPRWPPWYLIFTFSSTAEWKSTKHDRKQDLNVIYLVYVFRANRKTKMTALVSDRLRHFRLLWNRWTEFNETWQEARSQCPSPRFCFSGRSEKQDGRPILWVADTFSTSSLKLLNGIQRNLTGSKTSTSPTKFVFFEPNGKQDVRPAFDWLKHFRFLYLVARLWPFRPLVYLTHIRWGRHCDCNISPIFSSPEPIAQESYYYSTSSGVNFHTFDLYETAKRNSLRSFTGSKISTSSTKFVFLGPIAKQDCRPGLLLVDTFSTSPLKPLNEIQRNLSGSQISTSFTKTCKITVDTPRLCLI